MSEGPAPVIDQQCDSHRCQSEQEEPEQVGAADAKQLPERCCPEGVIHPDPAPVNWSQINAQPVKAANAMRLAIAASTAAILPDRSLMVGHLYPIVWLSRNGPSRRIRTCASVAHPCDPECLRPIVIADVSQALPALKVRT